MKDIKLREAGERTIKTVDRVADLSQRMKNGLTRRAERGQSLAEGGQDSPTEYAGEQVQQGMENVASDGGHLVVDMGRGAYRTGRSAAEQLWQKRRARAAQGRGEPELETGDSPDSPVEGPIEAPDPGGSDPTAPSDPEPTAAHTVDEPNRHTGDGATSKPAGSRPASSGSSPDEPAAPPDRRPWQPSRKAKPGNEPRGRPGRRRDGPVQPERGRGGVPRSGSTAVGTTRTAEQTAKTVKTVERSAKDTQRTVKTAQRSAKAAAQTARNTQRSATAAAKTAHRMIQMARAAARATAAAVKATAKAVVVTVKAIIAGVKSLVAAIAAGGWVAVLIALVICLVGLLVGSCFGIFFSSEDTGSMTMKSVVQEINRDYQAQIDTVKESTVYDVLEMSGSRAVWPEVLAVYAVKVNLDPTDPQEVASMDDGKKAMLEDIFWAMNTIASTVETREETFIVEEVDEDGNIIPVEVIQTVTTLYITVSHKTAEEMAAEYGFTPEQKDWLDQLLQEENATLWSAVLYGIHSQDEQIVAVALSQVGNVGGEPYWSWYGFHSRVEWCACFVSWCANECGYIENGIIPKFAGCVWGVKWFRDRGHWADGTATPVPGMIIFFDWDDPDGSSGPQDGESDHVGIVVRVEGGRVYTVEGNSGDACREKSYPLGYYEILGYGVPAH